VRISVGFIFVSREHGLDLEPFELLEAPLAALDVDLLRAGRPARKRFLA
jgi:hypothetical protein